MTVFFRSLFRSDRHSLPPRNNAGLQTLQRFYSSSPCALSAALDMQDAIAKH